MLAIQISYLIIHWKDQQVEFLQREEGKEFYVNLT